MKTGVSILAGLLAGVLVAVGVLAAFVFVGPDPVGLRPTPAPTLIPSASPVPSASVAVVSPSPSASTIAGPSGSVDPGAAFHPGQPAPALVVPQVGGGTIDLAGLKGQAVWLTFVQTTCSECVDDFPLMNSFKTRYGDKGLVVIAIDSKEDEAAVASFAQRVKATFPLGLDVDGKAQQIWGTEPLPLHVWIDKDGIVRAGAQGAVAVDQMVQGLEKILPGVTIEP